MDALEELRNRVQKLEDLEAIKQLKARYGRLADERYGKSSKEKEALAREVAELFTDDGLWDGGDVARARGREEIGRLFSNPLHVFAVHYFKLIELSIEGDKARASWVYFMPATKSDKTAVWQAGREDEEYVKIGGRWLISSLKMTLFFHTAFDEEGWGKKRVIGYD